MIINQGSNEYHHLKVNEIIDNSEQDKPYLIIKANGKTMMRDSTCKSGYKINPYSIRVYVRGMLMYYVLSEIDINDLIFVIGRTSTYKVNKFYNPRTLEAEAIYKEDWIKYYNNYGNVNPKDLEDML